MEMVGFFKWISKILVDWSLEREKRKSQQLSERGERTGDYRLVRRPGSAFLAVVPLRGSSCPISRV